MRTKFPNNARCINKITRYSGKSSSGVRGPFHYRFLGKIIEVWLGEPDHPESELVLAIDESYLSSLIAVLKMAASSCSLD